MQDYHTEMFLIRFRIRGDGDVGVQQSQHFLEDGGPSAVLHLAGHAEGLLGVLVLLLEGVVAVLTDDVTLTMIKCRNNY